MQEILRSSWVPPAPGNPRCSMRSAGWIASAATSLYFKDVAGANVTATPIGYYADTNGLADAVIEAYLSNIGDVWGVDVYF